MLGLFRKGKNKSAGTEKVVSESIGAPEDHQTPEVKSTWFTRLKQSLQRTRKNLGEGLANLVLGQKTIDAALYEKIETQLLLADVGIDATKQIMKAVTDQISRNQLADGALLYQQLRSELMAILQPCEVPLVTNSNQMPFVLLVVGVNGVGKTTTIGKLAKRFQAEGKKVMLAAGDTFRAAAVEQLQVWGQRNEIPVIAQATGADSASVIYDALQAAKARGIDIVIADTAGRLHTQNHLMQELQKVIRVMQKLDPQAPHEVMLVLDATIGQNALQQASQFNQAVKVSGLTLTKLDGTAKGGIIFAIAKKLNIPIRFIGVGEGIEDLRPFNAEEFVQALFDE